MYLPQHPILEHTQPNVPRWHMWKAMDTSNSQLAVDNCMSEKIDGVSKSSQIWKFMKIRPMEFELFHTDRQTDLKKLIVAVHNFANAPEGNYLASLIT